MQACHSQLSPSEVSVGQRRGFNLAELLFVIAAISALTVVVMTVVGLLISAEQHTAETLWVDVTVSNLAVDLRHDAHQALELESPPDEQQETNRVTFRMPDGIRVTYECTTDGVVRTESGQGDAESFETYRLALGSSTFRLPGEEGLLSFVHHRTIPSIGGFGQPTTDTGGVQRTLHVQTMVGLHAGVKNEDLP